MAHFEKQRDVISGPFSPEMLQQRTADGWQLVALEWRRELPDSQAPEQEAFPQEVPYGLRISNDCDGLEVHPEEHKVLTLMMEMLAQDSSYATIVSDLNEKGFRRRDGKLWTRVDVFNMMPRLIEVGPRMFHSKEWEQMRDRLTKARAEGD